MTRRLSIETLADRSDGLFGIRYDFSNAEYSNRDSILKLRCPVHDHSFEQRARNFLKGQFGCKHCRIERRKNGQKRGRQVSVDGIDYPSLRSAARAFDIREDVFYSRIQAGWTPEQAAESAEPPTFTHKAYDLTLEGRTFKNFGELGRHYNLDSRLVRGRVNKGWSLRQAVNLDPPPEKLGKKNPIVFRKVEYRNATSLALAFDVDPKKFGSRRRAGWSIERALGLKAPPRKRSWRRSAKIIDGRAYPSGAGGQFLLYLITCKLSGREYVGVTTGSLEKRWGEHLSNAKSDESRSIKLYRAIRKYGAAAFEIRLLRDDAVDFKDLLEQEAAEVAARDTFNSGLNSTPGGESVLSSRQIEVDGQVFPTLKSAASYFEVDESLIRSRVDSLGWTVRQAVELDPRPTDWGPKVITLEGVQYPSIKDACKAYGLSNKKVNLRMNRYGWSLEEAFEITAVKRPPGVPKAITFDGKVYKSNAALAKAHDIDPSMFHSRRKSGWSIEQALGLVDPPERRAYNAITFRIDGKTFNSMKAVAHEYGINYKLLSARLRKGWTIEEALGIAPRES
jgi:hypothetical protein